MEDIRIASNQTSSASKKKPIKFWVYTSKSGGQWKIEHRKFILHLRHMGFRRYDIDPGYIFIKIKDHVISEVQPHNIQDLLMKYIEDLDDVIEPEIVREDKTRSKLSRDELLSKFYAQNVSFFSKPKLSSLGIEQNIEFNTDTKENGFIYYSNCFVKCNAKGYDTFPYKDLSGYVFKNQIKDREFTKGSSEGMFQKFIYNIASKNDQRFEALKTMIGYLLHSFYETKMKAVNLTDSTISDDAEGRTGKTLLGKSISKIKNVCEISGKDFNPTDKNKYSRVKMDTQIVFLNDLKKHFDFECLFNDISDAITVDQKFIHAFTVQTKMLIASNDTFRIAGSSAKDRVIEFELANYYKVGFSPKDEFGAWFFTDWDDKEWLAFDNFMMGCLSLYLHYGILECDPINLNKRKQISETNRDFVEFIDDNIEKGKLRRGIDIDKTSIHLEFLSEYPDYKEDKWLKRTGNFIKYLKYYATYSDELKGPIKERKSNSRTYISFGKSDENENELPF